MHSMEIHLQAGYAAHFGGGCLCRSVRFRALAAPEKTNVCHCRLCQQLTGSAFLVEPVFLKQNIAFEGGPIRTYDHRSRAHGRTLPVHFCPSCGNTVSLTCERSPALRGIDVPRFLGPVVSGEMALDPKGRAYRRLYPSVPAH